MTEFGRNKAVVVKFSSTAEYKNARSNLTKIINETKDDGCIRDMLDVRIDIPGKSPQPYFPRSATAQAVDRLKAEFGEENVSLVGGRLNHPLKSFAEAFISASDVLFEKYWLTGDQAMMLMMCYTLERISDSSIGIKNRLEDMSFDVNKIGDDIRDMSGIMAEMSDRIDRVAQYTAGIEDSLDGIGELMLEC